MLRREKVTRGLGPCGPSRRPVTAPADIPVAGMTPVLEKAAVLAMLPPPSEFEISPGHDNDRNREQHHRRCGKALAEVLSREHVVIDIFCRHFGGLAGTA